MRTKTVLLTVGVISLSVFAAAQPQSTQSMQQNTPAPAPDCSNMGMKEQQFAAQMANMSNRAMFCETMTSDQRREVMFMATKPNAQGILMSPDQAMQQYMKKNNMTLPQPPAGNSGSTCPMQ